MKGRRLAIVAAARVGAEEAVAVEGETDTTGVAVPRMVGDATGEAGEVEEEECAGVRRGVEESKDIVRNH